MKLKRCFASPVCHVVSIPKCIGTFCLEVLELFPLAEYAELLLWNQPDSKGSQTSLTVEQIIQYRLAILTAWKFCDSFRLPLGIFFWKVLYGIVTLHASEWLKMGIESTLNCKETTCIEMTLYQIDQTPFEMADKCSARHSVSFSYFFHSL